MPPQVFSGTAGGGKTLLAKVTAAEINARMVASGRPAVGFIEVFTADVPNIEALDRYMRRVMDSPGCVFFIDELHSLVGKEHWYKFYLVLEEGRYLFEGDAQPTVLPSFTILGATTDFGLLPEALRRRFMCHTFVRATYDQLLHFVERTASASALPLSPNGARAIVDRMHYGGAPWEVIGTYKVASVFAKARGSMVVDTTDVEEVWDVNQIDDLGLNPVDRQVIRAILTQPRYRRNPEGDGQEFVCYASSESNTYQMARVDRAEYINYIRPKLMARGLLEIRITYGQALTQRCLELYGHLRT
jgi:Holliday junction DNA helicase RuvB